MTTHCNTFYSQPIYKKSVCEGSKTLFHCPMDYTRTNGMILWYKLIVFISIKINQLIATDLLTLFLSPEK